MDLIRAIFQSLLAQVARPRFISGFCPQQGLAQIVLVQYTEENNTDPPQSVQRGVTDLVEAALSPRNLCMMDPTWHPWF
ncbi:hypothetical protein ACLOJK_000787 [Asimina triloba]